MKKSSRPLRALLAPTLAVMLMTTGCTVNALTPVHAFIPVQANTVASQTMADSETTVIATGTERKPTEQKPIEKAPDQYTIDGQLDPADAAKVLHVSLAFMDGSGTHVPVDAQGHFQFTVLAAQSMKSKHTGQLIVVMKDGSQQVAFFTDERGNRLAFLSFEVGKQHHLGRCVLQSPQFPVEHAPIEELGPPEAFEAEPPMETVEVEQD